MHGGSERPGEAVSLDEVIQRALCEYVTLGEALMKLKRLPEYQRINPFIVRAEVVNVYRQSEIFQVWVKSILEEQ